MKKTIMSIFLVLMLALSPFGGLYISNVNADSANIGVENIEDITAIKGIDNSVDIVFDLTNRNVNAEDSMNLEVTSVLLPTSGDETLSVNNLPQTINDLAGNSASQEITFSVTGISLETVSGAYTGKIQITEVDANGEAVDADADGNADNFIEKTYTINVEDSRPSISFDGLTDDDEELVFTGEEDTTSEKSFTITNNGNRALSDLELNFPNEGEFDDIDDNKITFKIKLGAEAFTSVNLAEAVELTNLNVGESLTVTIQTRISEDIELDIYSGELTITSSDFENLADGLAADFFKLVVKVEPEVCKDGRVSDETPSDGPRDGNVRIDDFDVEEDNLDVGESIEVDVTIENRDNNDMDIIVEAMLYNLDQNNEVIDWTEVGSESIDEDGGDEDFTFELEIPLDDNEDIDPTDTFILYVKAFEDGDEDRNCNYISTEIEIDRDDDHVIIDEFTATPSAVMAGDVVSFSVSTLNVGTDEQDDVYVQITNTELGLDETSSEFDLDEFDKNRNDMINAFTFTVPADAEAKEYTVTAKVYFRDGREDNVATTTLIVQGEATPNEDNTPTDNTGNVDQNVGTGNQGAGAYQPVTGNSVLGNLGSTKTLFIIGDIVLVILAVLFLVLIFRRR